MNCTPVIWGEDNLLWIATKDIGATRVLKLTQKDGKTKVEKVWRNPRIQIDHWEARRIGDYVIASNGPGGAKLSMIDIKTGEIVQAIRGFRGMNSVLFGDKLVMLDNRGTLSMAQIAPNEIKILGSSKIFDGVAWTKPLMMGSLVIIRNRKRIMALDLGLED